MIDFSSRSDQEELMDDLDCHGSVVNQTLKELHIINTLLGGNAISLQALKSIVNTNRPLKIVDLGCGGGDILKLFAGWFRKKKADVSMVGVDANPNIVEYANHNCKDYPEIEFKVLDVLSEEFQSIDYDMVHCCLFTHHFSDDQLIRLFQLFKKKEAQVIVNDLHRHPLAYHSIKILTRFFSKSEMVKFDASTSVLRGFHKHELLNIMQRANITNFDLRWKWAFRWQIVF